MLNLGINIAEKSLKIIINIKNTKNQFFHSYYYYYSQTSDSRGKVIEVLAEEMKKVKLE